MLNPDNLVYWYLKVIHQGVDYRGPPLGLALTSSLICYVCDTLKSKALILLCCHLDFIKGIVISKCNFPISKPEHYANLLLDY